VAEQALAGVTSQRRLDRRKILFVEESGLSDQHTRVSTWAVKGETPALHSSDNRKQRRLIAGMTVIGFYFGFNHGADKSRQLVASLKAIAQQIGGRLFVNLEELPARRNRRVRQYVELLDERVVLGRLPAYAPILNLVQHLSGFAAQRELANLYLRASDDVRQHASGCLKSMQCRPCLITAFRKQA
jgi:hypothetical protein